MFFIVSFWDFSGQFGGSGRTCDLSVICKFVLVPDWVWQARTPFLLFTNWLSCNGLGCDVRILLPPMVHLLSQKFDYVDFVGRCPCQGSFRI